MNNYYYLSLVGIILLCIGIFIIPYLFITIGIILLVISIIFITRNKKETIPSAPTKVTASMNSSNDGIIVGFSSVDSSGQSISYEANAVDCNGHQYSGTNIMSPILITGIPINTNVTCPYIITVKEITPDGTSLPSDPIFYPPP
jgi:hypothetical protein